MKRSLSSAGLGRVSKRSRSIPVRIVSKRGKSMRRKSKKATQVVVKAATPFPDRFITKMKYIDDLRLGGAASFYQHAIYRANSLFDTDYNGIGRNAQPMGFDALCGAQNTNAPYLTYNVSNCYIKLDIINALTVPAYVVIWPSRDVVTPGSATAAFEQTYSKYAIVGGTAGTPITTIWHKFNTAKMFGETQAAIDTEDNYNGTYNTNPNSVWYWNVYVIACDGASVIDMRSRAELIYDTEYSDRNSLTQS